MIRLNYPVDVREGTDIDGLPIDRRTWHHPFTGMPMHVDRYENDGRTVVFMPGAARQ